MKKKTEIVSDNKFCVFFESFYQYMCEYKVNQHDVIIVSNNIFGIIINFNVNKKVMDDFL